MIDGFKHKMIYGAAPLDEMRGSPGYIAICIKALENRNKINNDL